MTITGGCLCGAVLYRISADPIAARTCWCRACQYTGAGNATVNVVFPSGAVSVEGPLTDYACKADSGNTMHRSFCPVCGTPVFTQSEARPQRQDSRKAPFLSPVVARLERMGRGGEVRLMRGR